MLPLRLEVSLQCVACKAAIALNAVAPRVTCGGCGRVVGLSAERWKEFLRVPLDEAAAMQEGEQRDAYLESPDGICRRIYRREAPALRRLRRGRRVRGGEGGVGGPVRAGRRAAGVAARCWRGRFKRSPPASAAS